MYIGDYLARREAYSPDALAIVDTGKQPEARLTYRQMNERANRLANWLRGVVGIGKGDRVAILAHDGVEHLDSFFACGKLGAIHTALNWRLHPAELAEIIERTTPRVLFYSDDARDKVATLRDLLQGHPHQIPYFVHIDGSGFDGSLLHDQLLHESSSAPVTTEALDAEDIAALIFTGGTTGAPKAAQISHRMIAWNTLNTVIHDVTHGDIYLNVFPLFHTGGLFVYTLPQVIFGGTTVLLPRFDPARVLELLERERVTIFAAVPTMYQMMTQAPNWASSDLSALRFCTSGGAPLPVPLVEQYTREKGIVFKQGFGMTEFGPGVFALSPDFAIRKSGSIGRPNYYIDAQIVDDNNHFLGPNQDGELVLKGPSYCSGYFGDPAASAAAVDDRGYFHTGDIARYDDDGFFYIVDRKKDMFISGGENIYPAEIEKVLYTHPAVLMCAVIGLPDPRWGEVGKACVVLRPDATADEAELLTYMSSKLARYKVPHSVALMEQLPISAAGKILKRELREEFIRDAAATSPR